MAVIKSLSQGKITLSAANDEVAGYFTPSLFRFIGATTLGHKAVLKDQGGNYIVFEAEASIIGDTIQMEYKSNKDINGFKLTTLGSGKVEIFLR